MRRRVFCWYPFLSLTTTLWSSIIMARHSSKKKPSKPSLQERRFVPDPTHITRPAFYAGLAASLLSGAGVYAQWLVDEPRAYGAWLLLVGIAGYALAYWLGSSNVCPVRVGDGGIAIESSEIERIRWCDLERLWIAGNSLVARGPALSLSIPLGPQSIAIAHVLKEAARRVPNAVDVKGTFVNELPKPSDSDGELVSLENFPVVGRDCAVSDEPIAFERDARLCPNCGEVYLKSKVPAQCVSCERPLGNLARALSS